MATKQSVKMLVSIADECSFGDWTLRFKAEPVVIGDDSKVYGPGFCGVDAPRELEDFQVDAYRDARYPSDTLTAMARFRNAYSIDLHRAEDMLKVLRKVDRKVTQLSERYGHAKDVAQYTAYVAEAIGVESFIRRVDAEHDFTGTGYREMNARDLAWWVNDQERAWEKKHEITAGQD